MTMRNLYLNTKIWNASRICVLSLRTNELIMAQVSFRAIAEITTRTAVFLTSGGC